MEMFFILLHFEGNGSTLGLLSHCGRVENLRAGTRNKRRHGRHASQRQHAGLFAIQSLQSLAHPPRRPLHGPERADRQPRILTANNDNTAKLSDAASGKFIASFDHLRPLGSGAGILEWGKPALHFSPDSARVLAASADYTAKLWDAASGKLLASFAHQDEVFQACQLSSRLWLREASEKQRHL